MLTVKELREALAGIDDDGFVAVSVNVYMDEDENKYYTEQKDPIISKAGKSCLILSVSI